MNSLSGGKSLNGAGGGSRVEEWDRAKDWYVESQSKTSSGRLETPNLERNRQ